MELSMQLKNWPAGILSLKAVEDLLKRHLRHTTFESMQLPFYITATNYQNGQRAVFSKGPVIPAILAASTIPLLLPPVEINGIPYVDGGLSGNLPVEPLLPEYEQIIGVHVNPIAPWNPAAGIRANVERTLNMAINAPVAASRNLCTWYVEPEELLQYRVFDFKKFEAIYNIGLQYTRGLLQTAPV
jgi:NTE family protein